ncbi:metallopeptidase TldD-related protein [Modestobacter marinus]|uniref:metallopeptidase TldD-related protein n=1 Tax=Modestobacter marinus TaxID=477641 RepID=UPI001C942215|nr:metallopeptidase TldD-related protein [Modestobacter marinus]
MPGDGAGRRPAGPGRLGQRCREGPFAVPIAEKGDLPTGVTGTMRAAGVAVAEALSQAWDTRTALVSSEGARLGQHIRECGAGMHCLTVGDGETQRRSYPAFRGQYGTRGWELVRELGWEAAFAGTSWLDLDRLGSLRFGSELVNITIDPTIPGALGSFGFDDEGTPAAARDAVRDGVWVGVLAGAGLRRRGRAGVRGSMRADGYARLPMRGVSR